MLKGAEAFAVSSLNSSAAGRSGRRAPTACRANREPIRRSLAVTAEARRRLAANEFAAYMAGMSML